MTARDIGTSFSKGDSMVHGSSVSFDRSGLPTLVCSFQPNQSSSTDNRDTSIEMTRPIVWDSPADP